MLLHSGITIKNGVLMMLDDEPDKDAKKVLQNLLDNLEGDVPLSVAMKNGAYFPNYMVSMIEVGEKTGRITETLTALAAHYDRQDRLLKSIKSAALYPSVLLGMMLVVVMILITQVLPIFNDVFGRMGAQMSPIATQLLQFGAWFRGASVVIAIIVGIIFLCAFLMWAIPASREGIVKLLKSKFGGSGLFGRIATFQFVSSMTLAMSSGLGVEESISLAASFNRDSKSLSQKYEKCMAIIGESNNLSTALKDSGILSARDSRMLSIGEQSGMGDSAMEEIARRSDRAVQDEIAGIVGRIEPTLVIITSLIVGTILLSVMLPLIGIMTSIG